MRGGESGRRGAEECEGRGLKFLAEAIVRQDRSVRPRRQIDAMEENYASSLTEDGGVFVALKNQGRRLASLYSALSQIRITFTKQAKESICFVRVLGVDFVAISKEMAFEISRRRVVVMEGFTCKGTKGARRRNDKGRRSWSRREEEVLVAALKEIVITGWKSENGFKIGYLQALEQEMAKALPGTDLKGIPHINSKIHVWKKDYGSLVSMLSRSGIGWNDSTKMIEVHDEVWADYVKVDATLGL
ncbi:hypothetical protein DH2020_042343 [Rehmannia glutinosa]|uniref:Myb/SANT-like domain-containing protein n=1 Tax=Rehmannia glutinosa TaxID=99300 RepID=A0ABR0UMN7_REHGL